MNYKVLFFVIGLALIVMGSVLFFVVSAGAKHTSNEVLRQQDGRELSSPDITKGLFDVGDPAFASDDHSCQPPFQQPAQVNVIMDYHRVPNSCDVFINGRYAGSQTSLTPECIGQCPYEEFSRTFPLGFLDVRENHKVRICCNDICVERRLEGLCAQAQ